MQVEEMEMAKISGGENGVGTTFMNYLSNLFKTVYGIGQGLGGAIRRIATNKTCQI